MTRLQVLADHYEVFLARCDVLGGEAVLFGDFEGETRNAIEINLHSGANTTPPWPGLQAVAISRNGRYVAYVSGEVRDTETGAIVARLRGQPEAISWLGHVVVQLVGLMASRRSIGKRVASSGREAGRRNARARALAYPRPRGLSPMTRH